MPQAKTEVALQFLECCAAETALQHSLFCSADVFCTKSCAAANKKLHCNIEIAALQESGAFVPLACGFQAPRLGTHVSDLLMHCIVCGIADFCCYTPILSIKVAYRNPKTDLTRGVSQKKLASEAYRAIGGVARNSIANRAIVGH